MVYTVNDGSLIFFTTSAFDSPAGYRRGATEPFRNPVRGAKRMRAGILHILLISRAGGTPLLVAGRLTQLAKIFSVIYATALRR